jgi:hypothetical protein
MQNLKNALKSEKGSALVGVVAVTIILSIAAITYAALVRNTVSNELEAYNDTQALLAAEQGVLLATNWLRADGGVDNWDLAIDPAKNGVTINIPTFSDNGFSSVVTLKRRVILINNMQEVVIACTSRATETKVGLLPYVKEVWCLVGGGPDNPASYATFLNNADNVAFGVAANSGMHHRSAFFGRVHSNTPILLSPKAMNTGTSDLSYGVRFYGSVSVYGGSYSVPSNVWHGNDFGGIGNKYSKGVMVNKTAGSVAYTPTESSLDRVFRGGFNSDANKMQIEFNPAGITEIWLGDAGSNTNPEIEFGDGWYKFNGGTSQPITGPTIINAGTSNFAKSYNLQVKGGSVLSGNVTVRTARAVDAVQASPGKPAVAAVPARDIIINLHQGNILYKGLKSSDFSTSGPGGNEAYNNALTYKNFGAQDYEVMAKEGGVNLGTDITSVFGFYSGGDVKLAVVKDGDGLPSGAGKDAFITAQLYAVDKGDGKVYIPRGNNVTRAHVVGTTSMNKWWDTNTGTNGGDLYNSSGQQVNQTGSIRMYHDKRTDAYGQSIPALGTFLSVFNSSGVKIPKPPQIQTTVWKERNVRKS